MGFKQMAFLWKLTEFIQAQRMVVLQHDGSVYFPLFTKVQDSWKSHALLCILEELVFSSIKQLFPFQNSSSTGTSFMFQFLRNSSYIINKAIGCSCGMYNKEEEKKKGTDFLFFTNHIFPWLLRIQYFPLKIK